MFKSTVEEVEKELDENDSFPDSVITLNKTSRNKVSFASILWLHVL